MGSIKGTIWKMLISGIILFPVLAIGSLNSKIMEQKILDKLLNNRVYDRVRPNGANGTGPTIISVNMYIRDFDINELDREFSVQITFRMQWMDDRLAYKNLESQGSKNGLHVPYYLTLDSHFQSLIWLPDLFFFNEKRSHKHDLMFPNIYIRIFSNGQVLYSSRLTLTLTLYSAMTLQEFPFDEQICPIRMSSYGYTTADIVFTWKRDDPVQVTPGLLIPFLQLAQFTTDYCDSHTNTGIYSCLQVEFVLQRDPLAFLLKIYVPSCMLVIIGWLSFWMDSRSGSSRLTMCLVTLLTYAVMVALKNHTTALAGVPYVKKFDGWTWSCFMFLFFALVECVLVNYLARKYDNEDPGITLPVESRMLDLADTVDILCRFMYPILFIIFMILFGYSAKPLYNSSRTLWV